jgi:AcrR family transcriptional regulator
MRYEKGRKGETRHRIMEVAGERFRGDGIAASGLAGIMGEAGMTNGAFYPHFRSKAELVRESLAAAMDAQSEQLGGIVTNEGLQAGIAAYLSAEHRDNPGTGCTLAALLPELARQPVETRNALADRFLATMRQMALALPPETEDPEGVALGMYATLIGALQLSRAVEGTPLSNRILAAGADAAGALAGLEPGACA